MTVDRVAVAGERLVDRVVDDLVDEVVQAAHAGRADVHAGALADRLEALEDGDVLGVVAAGCWLVRRWRRPAPSVSSVYIRDAPAADASRLRGRGVAKLVS